MEAIKIKEYAVNTRSNGQVQLAIPKLWIDDLGLKNGDKIVMLRDANDQLILRGQKEN